MSSAYNEWEEARREEAWEDIIKIAEIFESNNPDLTHEEAWYIIESILAEGGWI